MAGAGGEKRVLITFDVDGTLMHSTGQSANLLHKKAFSYAMKEVFGIDGTIDDIKVGQLAFSILSNPFTLLWSLEVVQIRAPCFNFPVLVDHNGDLISSFLVFMVTQNRPISELDWW